jgi:hypothetical protein
MGSSATADGTLVKSLNVSPGYQPPAPMPPKK